jgi:hypothetical protein
LNTFRLGKERVYCQRQARRSGHSHGDGASKRGALQRAVCSQIEKKKLHHAQELSRLYKHLFGRARKERRREQVTGKDCLYYRKFNLVHFQTKLQT